MAIEEDKAVRTDLHDLVKKEVDSKMKPILIMMASDGEHTRQSFKKLEDLVIRRRLFYRKVVVGFVFIMVFLILK
jgi:hypothetical protein